MDDSERVRAPDRNMPQGTHAPERLNLGQVIHGILDELDDMPESFRGELREAAAGPEARRVTALRRAIERYVASESPAATDDRRG